MGAVEVELFPEVELWVLCAVDGGGVWGDVLRVAVKDGVKAEDARGDGLSGGGIPGDEVGGRAECAEGGEVDGAVFREVVCAVSPGPGVGGGGHGGGGSGAEGVAGTGGEGGLPGFKSDVVGGTGVNGGEPVCAAQDGVCVQFDDGAGCGACDGGEGFQDADDGGGAAEAVTARPGGGDELGAVLVQGSGGEGALLPFRGDVEEPGGGEDAADGGGVNGHEGSIPGAGEGSDAAGHGKYELRVTRFEFFDVCGVVEVCFSVGGGEGGDAAEFAGTVAAGEGGGGTAQGGAGGGGGEPVAGVRRGGGCLCGGEVEGEVCAVVVEAAADFFCAEVSAPGGVPEGDVVGAPVVCYRFFSGAPFGAGVAAGVCQIFDGAQIPVVNAVYAFGAGDVCFCQSGVGVAFGREAKYLLCLCGGDALCAGGEGWRGVLRQGGGVCGEGDAGDGGPAGAEDMWCGHGVQELRVVRGAKLREAHWEPSAWGMSSW